MRKGGGVGNTKACEQGVAPLCAVQWGMRLSFPPCQVWTPNLMEYLDFPVTCECLAECQALNLRVVYVDNCVNASQMFLRAPAHARAREAWTRYDRACGSAGVSS